MLVELLAAVFASLCLSVLLNRVMLVIAPGLGLMDHPGERRIHGRPIPRAGGLAIWISFLAVVAAGLATGLLSSRGHLTWHWLGAFAAGSSLLIVTGYFDDRSGVRPLIKLAAHVLAPALFLLIHPSKTNLLPETWPLWTDHALFIVWVVILINAFNLIDGLDGLCAGLATVATFAMGGLALVNDRMDAAILLFIMAGAIIGFLNYNLNPARIFLGDAGSMLLGFFIATAATDAVGRKAVLGAVLLPIAVAGVPILDVLLAIWRRGMRRLLLQLKGERTEGGIFDADSDHLHHRLLRGGRSQRKVAVFLQAMAILLTAIAFLPLLFGDRLLGLSLVGLLIVGLAGLRHLIRVEVVHTGNVIHLAIKMPGRNRLLTGLLYAHDLLMLCLAVAIAVLLETGFRLRSDGLQKYLPFAVLFVTLGSLALIAARIHQRMWVRATVRDVLSLQFWLMAAAMASAGLYLVWSHEMGWGAIRLSLMSYVICILGISMPRVSLELTRELALEARHRVAEHSAEPSDYGAVAVFGAGDLGTLFLEHLKSSGPDQYKGMRLLGFLDDSEHLHGRRLRSFRILGGLSMIPHLVEQENLRGLIVAIKNPPAELLGRIERLRRKHGLTVYHWMASLDPITSAEDDLREEIHGGSGMQSNPPGRQPVAGAGGAGGPVVSGDDGRLS